MKIAIRHLVFFTAVFLLMCFYSRAQNNYMRFDLFTIDQKISQNDIFCIFQDQKGFLWFGTQDGLNRYDGYKFTIFRYEPSDPNSLSDGFVVALCEDDKNNIWIGTHTGGLNKFDPAHQKFSSFYHDPANLASLSSNHIRCLLVDKQGTLWIGTENGLNKMIVQGDKVSFKSYKNDPDNAASLSHNFITCLLEDSRGNLWVGTLDGLNLLNRKTEQFQVFRHDQVDFKSIAASQVNTLFQDSNGILWVGTTNGLCKFNHLTKTFKSYRNDPQNENSLSDNNVSAIQEEHTGLLWVGTRKGGLNEFNKNTEQFTAFMSNSRISHSLSHNDIISMLQDRSGTLWVGTLNGGLNKLNRRTKKFVHYETNPGHSNDLGHSFARGIYEDEEGILWVATSSGGALGGGLKRFNRRSGEIFTYENKANDSSSISHNGVWAICPNYYAGNTSRDLREHAVRSEHFWIGTTDGLNKFNKRTGRFTRYRAPAGSPYTLSSNFIYDIYEDKQGVLWLGTFGGGLNKVTFSGDKISQVTVYRYNADKPGSLSHDDVTDIHEDLQQADILWIGTRGGGLNRFDKRTGQFTVYKSQHNKLKTLSHNNVNAIYEDAQGRLWIATYGGGFNIFDKKTGLFTRISEKDGLPNNVVYGMLPDNQGNFWLSSNKGISRYNPETRMFKNYFVNDGLQSNEFNRKSYYKSDRGEMFFGGVNGFNSFIPDSIRVNDYIPNVVITDFKIFNKSVPIRDDSLSADSPLIRHISLAESIVLPYDQDVFEFEFSALHFDFPEKNMYAYKMENFDNDWIYTDASKRFATYTNLPPGEYTFRVKGSNSDGVWNNQGASIRVVITPPFWRTTAFYFLCMIGFASAIYGVIEQRERRLLRSKRLLEETVAQRTAEVLKQKEELEATRDEIETQRDKIEQAFQAIEKQNKNITSSINYAKRIQEAMLPLPEEITAGLPQSFVFFKPRDIVSGDFYWFGQKGNKIIIAAVDCTGHGVPGAFMSLIGESMLNEIIKSQGITDPAEILNRLHLNVRETLKQSEKDIRDGMDIALCVVEHLHGQHYMIEFAGAKNPLIWFSGQEMNFIPGDKYPIGGLQRESERLFTKHTFFIDQPASFYIFTDGYPDQFGGLRDTKFSMKQFKQLLEAIHARPVKEQEGLLAAALRQWQGDHRQIDDILVIGFRLNSHS